eukprot:s2755_g10.t1
MITAGRERARNLLSAACEWAEHSLRMADEAIVSLAMCSEALMKVVPPRSSFSGKRRPRPGGVRNTAKTSSLRTPDEAADVIALEQEVARLRGIVNSSEAQKEHSLGPQGVQQHKCAVDVEVQTQNASSSAGTLQRHVPMTPRTPARPSGSSLTACTKKWVTRVVNCGDHRTP